MLPTCLYNVTALLHPIVVVWWELLDGGVEMERSSPALKAYMGHNHTTLWDNDRLPVNLRISLSLRLVALLVNVYSARVSTSGCVFNEVSI